jgi:hypothetical protein
MDSRSDPSDPVAGQSQLQPDQSEEWVIKLAEENAPSLFVISTAITKDRMSAKAIVINVLADAYASIKRIGRRPDISGIYEHVVKESRGRLRQSPKIKLPSQPMEGLDLKIWPIIVTFDWRERLLCALHYILEWPDSAAAGLLGTSEGAVQTQLSIFRQRFEGGIGEGSEKELERTRIEQITADSIHRYFSPSVLSATDTQDIYNQALRKAETVHEKKWPLLDSRWPLVVGVGIFLVVFCLGVGIIISLGLITFATSPEFTPTPYGNTTSPSQPIRSTNPLTWLSSPKSIQARMKESSSLWNTLFIDMQTIDYGPPSYIGASRNYRTQAWVSQPGESIQLFGLLSDEANSVYVLKNGRNYYLNPVTNATFTHIVASSPESLIENAYLRQMIFPEVSRWTEAASTVRTFSTGQMLDRNILIVDWYNPYGGRESRLWLDSETGIVLRDQEFGGPDFDLLITDSSATELALDQSFPPARLTNSIREIGLTSSQTEAGQLQILQPTPTLAITPENRTALVPSPAYVNLDLSASSLIFQFPFDMEITNVETSTAQIPAKLFANGFYVDEIKFGLPWMLRCERSPDGYRLAFNTGSDKTATPDDRLRWFDLREPQKEYLPLDDLHTKAFAFSNDGRQIAAFAAGESSALNGIYLVEIATGEAHQLISLTDGYSIVWSPDDESLALIGTMDSRTGFEVLIVHIRTGQIAFQAKLPVSLSAIPADWPIANWGIKFPQTNGGMEACAQAPEK